MLDNAEPTITTCLALMRDVLREAASLANAAAGCADEGNRNGAIGIALEVEPLLAEAGSLLTVATALHRRTR
jgi:hypothetical protein